MAQLINILKDSTGQENLLSNGDCVATPPCTSFDILLPSTGEGILENHLTNADDEFPLPKGTTAAIVDRQANVRVSQTVLTASRYLDPETGSITVAFSRELASFYAALLTPVSPAARLFLQQTLVSSGDLLVLGRMTLHDMEQVRRVVTSYTPAVPEFFPLYAARVVVARAFNDELALRHATLQGTPVLLHTVQLLATAPRFSLLTLQQLTSYASPIVSVLGEIRRHEERYQLLLAVSILYRNAHTHSGIEEKMAYCGHYSACRMAALSALHLDRHDDALKLLETLSDEGLELDTPRQVLAAIALAQSGRFDEAIETAKYFVLLPELLGPLAFDQYADIDNVPYPEILGSIDLDNPEKGYQYELIDMRLFPVAAHLFQFVHNTLKDVRFDPNDPFTEGVAARKATTQLSHYCTPTVVARMLGEMLH